MYDQTRKLIEVAAGRTPADLVLKNAYYADVFSGVVRKGDIAICGEKIAGVGSYNGISEENFEGLYVLPGFIDSHVHIESSMLSPEEYARLVLPRGTTDVIADPHEICNVCGEAGLGYMIKASSRTPLGVHYVLPSCVPSTDFETSGAEFGAQFVKSHISDPALAGLGEFMDYPAVIAAKGGALEKICAARAAAKPVDGHAPALSGKALNAYAAAGVRTDHECLTPAEVEEKISAGMYVQLRFGSSARDAGLSAAVTAENFGRFLVCSDDRHAADLKEQGHIDYALRRLVAQGVPAVRAVTMATLNAALRYNLEDTGAVAPGYFADFAVVDNLRDFNVSHTYKRGKLVAKNGQCICGFERYLPPEVQGTVKVKPLSAENFRLRASGKLRAISFVPDGIFTKAESVRAESKDGNIVLKDGLLKLAVCERHGKNGNIALGLLKDYGFRGGALAVTVAHDSHNLIILGDDDGAMAAAGNRLIRTGGGMAVAASGGEVRSVRLSIAGLMSSDPAEKFIEESGRLYALVKSMGVKECYDPFLTFAFAALPVIPELRLTDKGLFDVGKFTLVPLEEQ